MTLQQSWLNWCIDLACAPPGSGFHWDGARKIFQHRHFDVPKLDGSIDLHSIGYTKSKLTILHKGYFVPDAVAVAMRLHEHNVKRRKYASAAFHCYGHLIKGSVDQQAIDGFAHKSTPGSRMGPCLQSVVMTLRPQQARTSVDVFYRTTEAFKKLPADFIWLHERVLPLIPGQDQFPVHGWRFHFVNVTIHSMYFATILPLLPDPIATLELIRTKDYTLWSWIGKWTVRYLIGGEASRSIAKFAQAQRSQEAAVELLQGEVGWRVVQYLNKHREAFLPTRSRFDRDALLGAFDNAMREWRFDG